MTDLGGGGGGRGEVRSVGGQVRLAVKIFFRKTRSGRRDQFRTKIVQIGAILAIFESLQVFLLGNVLLRTQGLSFFEHKECLSSNTRNAFLRTQGMSFFEHKDCPSSTTRNVLLRTQGLSFFEHKELSFFKHKDCSSNTRNCPSSNTRNFDVVQPLYEM